MTKKTIAPFGSWNSPITTDMVTANAIRIAEIICYGDAIYWLEFRANESGRQVIVRLTPDGNITDITPPEFNVRNRVHEYGGAAYQVFNGMVYFCNYADQRPTRFSMGWFTFAIMQINAFTVRPPEKNLLHLPQSQMPVTLTSLWMISINDLSASVSSMPTMGRKSTIPWSPSPWTGHHLSRSCFQETIFIPTPASARMAVTCAG